MSSLNFIETEQGRKLAYHFSVGESPTIVFLAGLKSDMNGTKALRLEEWSKQLGFAFLRFDYSGHGESSGRFEDGCIGDWHQDTLAIIDSVTTGPIVLVGSSMGGWQALLVARTRPNQVAGIVTVAAAPDFTEDFYWVNFSAEERNRLLRDGYIECNSDYDEPYIISRRLIEDSRKHLVLRSPLILPFPVRCLQGTEDTAVTTETAIRLFDHANSRDMVLTLVKDADHRFSDERCLELIKEALLSVLTRVAAAPPI
ncbi:MAG: alpha/beta hydrolase [Aestuariivita sp.]|nr:alpha/beta hydrolase [Aestuariivita sp.]MCY4203623.1 alpha/beta hydrolase [Aestuariivita sp.]MCY4288959.1 alpha/beta hydrolase [Aestuariivita sp.]MCY4346200.1 alpha/beta hydrolase [Aestuariivita sp.]